MRERAEKRRQAFRAWMARNGLNVSQVYQHCGMSSGSTIYDWLAGETQSLKATTEARIAESYGVAVDEIFGAGLATMYVPLVGRVGIKSAVHPLDQTGVPATYVPRPEGLPDGDYVAIEIAEDVSFGPALRPGYMVFFRNQSVDPGGVVGQFALVDVDDGQRFFRTVRRGYTEGCWNLESLDGSDPIENVRLSSCLPFAYLTPGKHAR